MGILGPKAWINNFRKISIFLSFWNSFFYSLVRRFSVLEYRKIHFLGPYCLKKKWKDSLFWTKTMRQSLWKSLNFSTFWTSCFYSLERRFFVVEYRKIHFPSLYCLKKKVGTMAIFGPKPRVNLFGKNSIFRLF